MAKKNRSNALFANQDVIIHASTENNQLSVDMLKMIQSQTPKMTIENKEKLEMFDNMQHINSDLLNKNEELTERISEYIVELSTLREENATVKDLSTQIDSLKAELIKKNEEIDSYLIRISELTFENSRLNSLIQNRQTHVQSSTQIKPNSVAQRPRLQKRNFNGYESWN